MVQLVQIGSGGCNLDKILNESSFDFSVYISYNSYNDFNDYDDYNDYNDYNAQFWVVRWPSSQMAIAIKTLSHGKTIVLRLFFLYCFRKKTLKLVSLFIFRH